jgi:SAM-dependent methyltransferase
MNLKNFWENCNIKFAHIRNKEIYEPHYKQNVLPFTSFNNKTIVDYGIGKAHLGKLLLQKHNISKYIGIDISERQLKLAKENLKEFNNISLLSVTVDFSTLKADIFVSLACIQHFPSLDYLKEFLNNINNSNIKEVILQYRDNDIDIFNPGNYETINDVCYSCKLNLKTLLLYLDNYSLSGNKEDKRYSYRYIYLTLN